MNQTISYYNNNAESYYKQTKDVDFSEIYARFLKYIPDGGTIADLGCGSGRDTMFFASHGYQAFGVDASEELAKIVAKRSGVQIVIGDISSWISDKPLDGIWCCASLLHLSDKGLYSFFDNLSMNLKQNGAIFISVKSDIDSGFDNKGRFMRNFTLDEIKSFLSNSGIDIADVWISLDNIGRKDTKWINVIGIKTRGRKCQEKNEQKKIKTPSNPAL